MREANFIKNLKSVVNNMKPNLTQNNNTEAKSNEYNGHGTKSVGSVAASCITKINSRYYLLIENVIDIPGSGIRTILALRLTDDEAKKMFDTGIENCEIADSVPTTKPGFIADFKGVLCIENHAFLVFDTSMTVLEPMHHIILVNAPICPIIDGTT